MIRPAVFAAFLLISALAVAEHDGTSVNRLEQRAAREIQTANQTIQKAIRLTPSEQSFNEACKWNCDSANSQVKHEIRVAEAHREAVINQQILHINRQVDEYVAATANPAAVDGKLLAFRIKHILGNTCLDGPFIFTGRDSIIITYTLNKQRMGSLGTAVTIRAYHEISGRYQLAASAGGEMNGNMKLAVQELRPPLTGERWLITSGYMTGANGPSNSLWVYAYNGNRFRSVWSQRYIWGTFVVVVTDVGFRVDGEYYRTEKKRHDNYVVARTGVYAVKR